MIILLSSISTPAHSWSIAPDQEVGLPLSRVSSADTAIQIILYLSGSWISAKDMPCAVIWPQMSGELVAGGGGRIFTDSKLWLISIVPLLSRDCSKLPYVTMPAMRVPCL